MRFLESKTGFRLHNGVVGCAVVANGLGFMRPSAFLSATRPSQLLAERPKLLIYIDFF
jgi:hypothetical protein